MARQNVSYYNPIHQEENTPQVTILETSIEKKQSTAIDARRTPYVIDLSRAAFGGTTYPEPGSQWLIKKVSGVWTLMARGPQQNPQLDPTFVPQIGDTYLGHTGTTVLVGKVETKGNLTADGNIILSDNTKQIIFGYTGGSNASIVVNRNSISDYILSCFVTGDTQRRLIVGVDGKLSWGSGSATQDVNLYRTGPNSLATDNFFTAAGGLKIKVIEVDTTGSTTADVFRYDGAKYAPDSSVAMIGEIRMWPTVTAPPKWQLCDGSSLLRASYPTLSALLQPSIGTMTISIATPAVVSFTGHGLSIGDKVFFTTTGALPTGVSSDTTYWVIAAGFTANSFEISTTQTGAAINTSGTQSGVHTLYRTYFGVADSTHFNVPNYSGLTPVGRDPAQAEFAAIGMTGGEKTHTLSSTEMPVHTHGLASTGSLVAGGSGPSANIPTTGTGYVTTTISNAGGGGAHNNLQPYMPINYIIRLL